MGRGLEDVGRGFQVVGRGYLQEIMRYIMYLKKAGLTSRNIVHPTKNHSTFCFYFLLSPSRLTTTEGRERNATYDADLARHVLVLLSVSCASFRRKHGRRYLVYRERKKGALGLALGFMHTSACFHDMCCFTCTYVRACVTSENKAFMLVPVPGLCF